jgi:PAS domain S-box-containing protein
MPTMWSMHSLSYALRCALCGRTARICNGEPDGTEPQHLPQSTRGRGQRETPARAGWQEPGVILARIVWQDTIGPAIFTGMGIFGPGAEACTETRREKEASIRLPSEASKQPVPTDTTRPNRRMTIFDQTGMANALAEWYNNAPVGHMMVDRQGIILDLNRTAALLLGQERSALLNKALGQYVRSGRASALSEHLAHAFACAEHTSDDFRCRLATGETLRAVRLDSRVWNNPRAGKVCLTTLTDVTEHNRTTEALQAREAQQAAVAELGQRALSSNDFQALLDAVTDTVTRILKADYTKVLQALPEGDGLLLRAGTGWNAGLVGHAIVGNAYWSQGGYALATREPVIVDDLRTETRFQAAKLLLEHHVTSGISCVIAGPEGSPWGVLGAHTRRRRLFTQDDVNFLTAIANVLAAVIERRHYLKALHEREADLIRAQAIGGIGSWRRDLRRNWLNCSAEHRRIFGIRAGTRLTYEAALAAVHPDDRDDVERAWLSGTHDNAYDIEYRLVLGGSVRWVRERGELDFENDGKLLRSFGTTQDITERKRTEAILREHDRRKNEFLAMLAHELRNPLAPIRNAIEILRRNELPDRASQDARDIIERQLNHLVRLVDDLLDIGRITSGRLRLHKDTILLSEVIEQAVEVSMPQIEHAKHNLTVSLPSQPILLDADPIRLGQVFLELLDNACKYTETPGSIEIGARRDGDEVLVHVRDTGPGIPSEVLPSLFEIFARSVTWPNDTRAGLGVGLPLARRLLEMHDGTIEVRSGGPGLGSEFTVRLPAFTGTPAPRTPEPAAQEVPAVGVARRVLVVDDNVDIADSLALAVQLAGHEVRKAYGGAEALETSQRYRPDLIVLDIGMPGLDGYATCRRIREEPWGRDIVIVALTGWGQQEARQKSRDAGFDAHLVKPVDPSTLIGLLSDHPAFAAN